MLEALDEPLHIPKLDLLLWFFLASVCGAAIFGSVKASNAFVGKYDANAKRIAAAEKSVEKVAKAERGSLRPNAALIKDVDSRREALNKQLLELWQGLYDRQAKFCVWPKASGIGQDAEEGKEGAKEVAGKGADKKAAGKKAAAGAKKKDGAKGKKEDISPQACQLYNDSVVRSEFERIFAKLDPRRPKPGKPTSLENLPFKDQPADFDGLVAWDPQQRETIISRHHLAKGTPSSARVKLVQEDLWVFESLIDVLAAMNHGVKDALSAPVKQIDVLDVAQWATAARRENSASIWVPEPPGAAMPVKPPATPGEDSSDEAFADGRYLDQKGQPLPTGAPQPFAEFKQIFVYMRIVLDQRRLDELLAALANASLPVEVRHVSVQVRPDSTVRELPPAAGEAASAAPPPPAVTIGSLSVAESTAWDASVEIGGVIYIYSPPNVKKLGGGAKKSSATRTFGLPPSAAVVPAR